MSETATIQSIYRYPVKGLSPESLDGVRLEPGRTLPADRMYAIENGPSGFDPTAPAYLAKTYFLMLMKNERLATLDTLYDEDTHVLTIHGEGREMVRGDLRTKEGRLAIETVVGVPVHPLRFRANLYVEGWPAWHEFELLGKELAIGDARLKVTKRIVRCAATNVDPDTGARDLTIPATLMQTFDHADCGIYAQVITAGDIAPGSSIVIPDSPQG